MVAPHDGPVCGVNSKEFSSANEVLFLAPGSCQFATVFERFCSSKPRFVVG